MIMCLSYSREIPDDSRACRYCADAVEVLPGEPTVTAPSRDVARAAPLATSGLMPDSIDQARFTPQIMLTAAL